MQHLNEKTTLQLEYSLTHSLAELLLMLVRHRVVTPRMVEEDLKLTSDIRMSVHRLRHALAGTSIKVKALRKEGYYMDMADRKMLFDLVRGATSAEEDLLSPDAWHTEHNPIR